MRKHKGVQPVLGGEIGEICPHCHSRPSLYLGDFSPIAMMDYLLVEHKEYLMDSVLKNVRFLNSQYNGPKLLSTIDRDDKTKQ